METQGATMKKRAAKKRATTKRAPSQWPELLTRLFPAGGVWIAEHRFAAPRRWRFDLANLEAMIAIEIEGGSYRGGRHTSGAGFRADMAKYNAATVRGWRLLRYTPQQMEGGAFMMDLLALM
jgi:hypothetical protein